MKKFQTFEFCGPEDEEIPSGGWRGPEDEEIPSGGWR